MFQVFTHLYDGLVQSVINYGACIWGHREFACIESIHNRACRYFLGVGSKTLYVEISARRNLVTVSGCVLDVSGTV